MLFKAQGAENYGHVLGLSDYRRGMYGTLDLLTTCIHHSEVQLITDHWHAQISLLSLLQFPLAVSWQLLPSEILQLPWSCCCPLINTPDLNSQRHLLNLPWRPQMNCQPPTELTHQPLHFTSVNWTVSTRLGSSLYSLWANPTENTVSNSSIVVMGSCLAVVRVPFPRERVYRGDTKQCMFILGIVG
jgi:hypothetical protein